MLIFCLVVDSLMRQYLIVFDKITEKFIPFPLFALPDYQHTNFAISSHYLAHRTKHQTFD
jgi:hypothetical protein